MTIGIRVRGSAGQLQISDDAPTYMVVGQGAIGQAHKELRNPPPPGGSYYCFQEIVFPIVITTIEPPLVFMRFTNMIQVNAFYMMGGPGAWTGFLLGTGIGINIDKYALGDYFIASASVPKSNDPIGIRIRDKLTNEIIFDSGYPLVKFLSYSSSIWLSNSDEDRRWMQAGAGTSMRSCFNASKPAGAYQLMNTFGRFICEPLSSSGYRSTMQYGYDPASPGVISLFLWIGLGTIKSFNIGLYAGCFIFATMGN